MDARSTTVVAGPSQHSPRQPPLSSPIPLSKRTSSRNALNQTYHSSSPPTTPPPRRRTRTNTRTPGKTAKTSSSKGKETANAPVPRTQRLREEHTARDPDNRHSHGLSWSSTTRDSVVDNLLLSLDNLSSQQLPGGVDDRDLVFDKEKYRLPDMPELAQFGPSTAATRPRGHTYSSSLSSSGYDPHDRGAMASPSSRYSTSTKGRRSNSSSNFGAVKSTAVRRANGTRQMSSETQRPVGTAAHARSPSSDLDSSEYGYGAVQESTKPYFGGRRSMSMDQIYMEANAHGPSVLERGRPVPSVFSPYDGSQNDDDDAAPEPGIPAGPRRKLNPTATGPVYVNAAPSKQSLRKINTQSDLRSVSKPGLAIPQHIQAQASDFVRENSMRGMPNFTLPPKYSVSVSTPGMESKRRESPHRERPGFFRRVFGGASRSTSGNSERNDSRDTPREEVDYLDRPSVSRSKSQVSTDTPHTRPETGKVSKDGGPGTYPPPVLTKKPSSFFRRRKKSEVPPPLPINHNINVKPAEPSPSISSLRKVMDPFLGQGPAPAIQTDSSRPTTQESDELDIFHSGYTPPPDASLGSRDPLRREGPARTKQSLEQVESPRMKIKVKKLRGDEAQHARSPTGTTFLHDASREVSTATIGEHFQPPKVSPLTESPPGRVVDDRPVSDVSTIEQIFTSRKGSSNEPSNNTRTASDSNNVSNNPDGREDGWIVVHSAKTSLNVDRPESKKSERLILTPTELEDQRAANVVPLSPLEEPTYGSRKGSLAVTSGTGSGTASPKSPGMYTAVSSMTARSPGLPSEYHSTTSLPIPSFQVDGKPRVSLDMKLPDGSSLLNGEGAEYRERARRIYEGDEEDVTRAEASSWLGERNTLSTKTLQAYMQFFDFSGMNVLSALRALCGKLLLKGETQQFDRIINALSERWCECNPNHGFKAQDVVHTICYSLILLNTDLHLADIGEKMSKSAYVKNTLPTIRRVVADAAPNAFDDTVKPSQQASRPPLPWIDSAKATPPESATPPETPADRTSFDVPRPTTNNKRLSIRPGVFRSESDGWTPDSATGGASNALVNQPWTGPMRTWEPEIEMVLKSFFSSIRSEPLPLMGAGVDDSSTDRNLSVANLGVKRSGSVISKAPSDNASYRSKPGFRTMTNAWQNRGNRARPKIYPASTVASSRTSFDDSNSVWSPAQSSTWSKNSFSKTLTSASMNSLGYHQPPAAGDFKHSIGFANALSQAIIKEEGTNGASDNDSISVPGGLLEDEALALEGAPWAKEGLVKHKHHLESPDRKAKVRDWVDCLAVVSKGKLTLFAFGTSSKSHSMGRKSHAKPGTSNGRAASLAATKVGGGDWMENAEQLDTFPLRQTIASTLPPPGYGKTRPHVWALSMPSGAVHLFQVGTPEIAQEFMTSANYWSARLSKEPLSGSVSNVEYGWSEQVINPALLERPESAFTTSPPSSLANIGHRGHMPSTASSANMARPSFQSSVRTSFDTGFGTSGRLKLPGDKIQIADWQPPTQGMMANQLLEVDQLKGLMAYVNHVDLELEKHNELKHAIELAYTPRHTNYNRAMANWQRKSDYLLRESVKFRTYIEALNAAQKAKERFNARRVEHEKRSLLSDTTNSSNKGGVSPVDSGRMREERDDIPRPPPTARSTGGNSGRFREELG